MQTEKTDRDQPPSEDGPPIFRTWKQMYAFVLILHTIIIILFYLFTRAYS